MWAMRPVSVFGSPVHSSNAVWVISSMSSVSVLARSSVPPLRGDGVGRRRGVDGDAVVVQLGGKAFGQPVERGLDRAIDTEARRPVELGERRPAGRSPPTDVTLSTHPRPRSRMAGIAN